ncbi:MAG: hypothetical protein ACSHXK_15490 [Oceanococcus sp.]
MLKPILSATMILLLSACAHQPADDKSNDSQQAKDSRSRVDDAFEDGRCDSREARDPARSQDCQQQSARQKRQDQSALPTDDLLNDRRIGDLGRELDRSLPNMRSDGLGL